MFTEFVERGLSVIPVLKFEKRPVLPEWQQFSHRLPTLEEARYWDEKYPGYNIGLVLGPASNLVVVDIDVNEKRVLDAAPPSPVRRFGSKGEARFFRYNPEISSQKIGTLKKKEIDILCIGNQVILPPSIHPTTRKPFLWITPDTLENFDVADLPQLTLHDIETMKALYLSSDGTHSEKMSLAGISRSEDRCYPHGSQDRLKILATRLLHDETSLDKAVKELLAYDSSHHKPVGYFDAVGLHGDATADRYTNAVRFYSSIMRTINAGRVKEKEAPLVPRNESIEISEIDLSKLLNRDKKSEDEHPYPEARGMMLEFQKCCALLSNTPIESLSLGGSICLMSVLAANKFCTEAGVHRVMPNVYVLNLGYSGFGKEIPQKLLVDLLADHSLLGPSIYRSSTSLVKNLPEKQERLDVMDEFSGILKAMNSTNYFQQEMVETLCSLFSKAESKYLGIESSGNAKDNKNTNTGACWNPHISILGSTTPQGFKESVTHSNQSKGLMPRFLSFYQKHHSSYEARSKADLKKSEEIKDSLLIKVQRFVGVPKIRHSDFNPEKNLLSKRQGPKNENLAEGTRYHPKVLSVTEEVETAYQSLIVKYYSERAKDLDSFESAFLGRLAEHTMKLALLDALSLDIHAQEVTIDNFAWANAVVEAQWQNSKPLYQLSSGQSEYESDLLYVLQKIKEAKLVKKRELTRRTQKIDARKREAILKDLVESERVKLVEDRVNSQGVTFYQFCS